MRVVGEAREARGKAVGVGGPRAEARVEVEIAVGAGAEVPPGIHDEQLDADRRGAVHFGDHQVFGNPGAVREPRVVGDERLKGAAAADAVHDERAQRGRFVAGSLRLHAEEGVRQLDRAIGGNRGGDARKKDADVKPVAGALERGVPRAGPHQPPVKLILLALHEEQRQERLRRSSFGSDFNPLGRLQVAIDHDERVLGAGARGVAAQPAQPADAPERHGELPAREIAERDRVAAGADDARPGFDGRRAGVAGVHTREDQAVGAVFEREGQHHAAIGRLRGGSDERHAAARRERDALAAGRQRDVGPGRDVPRPPGLRVDELLDG